MSEVEKLFEEFKGRLVEVECECDDEKRAKCVMYPEYCDGTRKEIIDLVQLIDEGLNNRLLADKDTRIEELENENFSLKEQYGKLKKLIKRLYDETSDSVINRGFDIQLFDEIRHFLEYSVL